MSKKERQGKIKEKERKKKNRKEFSVGKRKKYWEVELISINSIDGVFMKLEQFIYVFMTCIKF